jgi:hypothetical protein
MAAANTYAFQAPQLQIGYSTLPEFGFFYQDAQRTLRFFGQELRLVKTEIGELVTVTIQPGHAPGQLNIGMTSFTLLIPNVELGDGFGPLPINSLAIYTLHVPPIFSVHPFPQQSERYTEVALTGTARFLIL